MPRACNECTVCCTVMYVPTIEKAPYTQCKNVCERGCAIYETRPSECSGYSCLWLIDKGDILREEDRPDKSGLLFEMSSVHRDKSAFEEKTGIAFLIVREGTPGAFESWRGQKVLKRLSKKALIIRAYADGRRVAMGPPEKIRAFGGYLDAMRGG